MFKVICIDERLLFSHPKIEAGSIYTVESIEEIPSVDYIGYRLKEITTLAPDGEKYSYWCERFALLSNIDERTIQKQRELDAIINVFSFEHSI